MAHDITAVFPGTFDPLTLGHEDLVQRSLQLFGRVIIAVAAAHHKKTLFSLDERLHMARAVFEHHAGVTVEPFTGLVRDFVVSRGANVMVRGVRGVVDFDYESQLAGMNRRLAPDVDTVFLLPSVAHQMVSSTFVREIATLGGDYAPLVSPVVRHGIAAKLKVSA
jgi:pantetheine-phosphate adenylyltransferase